METTPTEKPKGGRPAVYPAGKSRFEIPLTPTEHARLRALSASSGVPQRGLARHAIMAMLDKAGV